MEEEENDIEDEMEDLEEEIAETAKKAPSKKQQGKELKATEQPTERYTAFYQEPRIGILDTVTKEVIIEGLSDVTSATLEAFKLNKLDRIEIASGA